MKDRIGIHVEDGVADVQLIRADKMNALDDAMFAALIEAGQTVAEDKACLLYTSPSPRDRTRSRMPSSA